jgi:putative membrane protein insertion efficiency factor
MKKILISVINLYQKTLSPDHGLMRAFFPNGFCKYHPSCSEYTKQIIQKRGFVIGLLKGIKRVLKCNPWSKGGIDLPS